MPYSAMHILPCRGMKGRSKLLFHFIPCYFYYCMAAAGPGQTQFLFLLPRESAKKASFNYITFAHKDLIELLSINIFTG